jgi:phosphohistidine swiveling domain-containing protein
MAPGIRPSPAPVAAPSVVSEAAPPVVVPDVVPFVIPFAAIAPSDAPLVGGKAFSLGVLAAAGQPVPEGFALTTRSFLAFLESAGLAGALAEAGRRCGESAHPSTVDWLASVRTNVIASPLPPEIAESIRQACGELFAPDTPLAVRSSGTQEDLEGASFAGLYETYLNVRGETALHAAIKQCWASLWQPRVLDYLHRHGGGRGELGMAVVVQRLVEAEVAGVLFTVDPLSGHEGDVVVEAVFGLGESLVSGRVNADRYLVDVSTGAVKERHIAHQAMKIVSAADGNTREVALGEAEGSQPTLTDRELAALAETGAAIQEHHGRPMDVEWVRAGGKLYVVQARPITRLHFAPDLGEWTTADFRDGGVSSDVCSPFMWSLYELALEHSMPAYFRSIRLLPSEHRAKWGRMFFARPYWNLLEVKKVLEKIPGYRERNFDTDLGITPSYEGPGTTTPVTFMGVMRALPVLFALGRSYRDCIRANQAFAAGFAERKKPFDLDGQALAALDATRFVARYRALITDLYFETETSYFQTIYNTSNSKLDFKVEFDRANRAAGGTLNYAALVSGLENLSHLRPMKDMHDLLGGLKQQGRPLDDATVRAFALRWRQHGRKELDIRVPRWPDDLGLVRTMLEQALASWRPDNDPESHARAQHAAFAAERSRALAALGRNLLARRAFQRKLDRVRGYAWWREEMRDHSSYVYYLVRQWSLEAGERLVAGGLLERWEDVWALPHQDVIAALEGAVAVSEVRRRVRVGQRLMRSFRNFQNPNEIGSRHELRAAGGAATTENALRGTACSPGRAEGRARVVKTLDEATSLVEGDILVTVFTDPGWTPLFPRLAAVVTESGGLLSHAAVISREYGIPAVLAVAGATRIIRDGDRIVVDGTSGLVEIVAS